MLHPGLSISTRLHPDSVRTPVRLQLLPLRASGRHPNSWASDWSVWLFSSGTITSGTNRRASHSRGGFQRFAMGSNVSGISTLQRGNQQGFHRLRSSPKGQEPRVDGEALAQVYQCVSCRQNRPVLEHDWAPRGSGLLLRAMLPSAVRGSAEEQLPTLAAGGRACCSLRGPGAGGCAWGMLGRSGQNLQPTAHKNNRRGEKLLKLFFFIIIIFIAAYIRRESETEEHDRAWVSLICSHVFVSGAKLLYQGCNMYIIITPDKFILHEEVFFNTLQMENDLF